MATTDAAFLAEVDHFLNSFELPPLPLSVLHDTKNDFLSLAQRSEKLVDNDAVSKYELERMKDRKRRRALQERKRNERLNLQKETKTLTMKLERTKVDKQLLCKSAWQMLAQRELTARRSSEAKKAKLNEAIDAQNAWVQEFRQLFHEYVNSFDGLKNKMEQFAKVPYQPKRIRIEPSDTAIFAMFTREIHDIRIRTDPTLLTNELDPEENWDAPVETWTEHAGSGFSQFRSKITVPYDYQNICHRRWHASRFLHRQDCREQYDEVEDPENTLALKFRVTTRLVSGKVGTALQRIVVRRYEKDEQMVLVWRLFTEGEGVFRGMNSDETGWAVNTPTKTSSKAGTVIRTCVQNVPMHTSNKIDVKLFNSKLYQWGLENQGNAMLQE